MTRSEYTADELLAEHAYAQPLVVDGARCHGGFIEGAYVSPRTLWRAPAITAWQERLPAGEVAAILDPISTRIPPHFPNPEQTRLLVRHGVTLPLVRILSLIAIIEGYGGEVLRTVPVPPFQERVREPINGTALAHLKPLFEAHARDEAGHRAMWELARDIALDHPSIPKDLAPNFPPPTGLRLLPEIPADLEAVILRMLGVLIVEVFAVEAFTWAKTVLGDAALFVRHDEAATLITYIQQDEAPHVGYLATALAELRARTLMADDGAAVSGRTVIDRARALLVDFQTGPRHQANCSFRMQVIARSLAEHPQRDAILANLRALGPTPALQ
jgi:hypothetical protein